MKNKKYYSAKLVGIDPSFKIKYDDLYKDLDQAKKIVYDEIIVTKERDKYKEIVTGKKYESLDLAYNKETNTFERKIPYTSNYVVNDLLYKNILLKEATTEEVINYLKFYYDKKTLLLTKLNYIQALCDSYMYKAVYFDMENKEYSKKLIK